MTDSISTVPSLRELRGTTVRSADGDRLGAVHDVRLDADGRISQLVVRKGWFSGTMRDVSTEGMRMVDGDVVLAAPSDDVVDTERPSTERPIRTTDTQQPLVDDSPLHESQVAPTAAPVAEPVAAAPVAQPVLVGRDRASASFGGADLGATLAATFMAIGVFVVLGGMLAAWLGDGGTFKLDTGVDSLTALSTGTVVAGFATLFVAYLIGGWAAGRMSRYDGSINGMLLTPWTIVLALVSAGLGSWVADKYDVFSQISLPRIDFSMITAEGALAVIVGLIVMLIAGALGGALGTIFHRRADKAMMVDPID